jgi:hypothetical protein
MDARLSEKEKDALAAALTIGNTREIAANVVGLTAEELLVEDEQDPQLGQKIMRSEAAAEVHHMHTIHKAAQDEKNWRTSAWWIDRRDRQRSTLSKWSLGEVTAAISAAVKRLLEIIVLEVPDAERRHAIVTRLLETADNSGANAERTTDKPLLPAFDKDNLKDSVGENEPLEEEAT